MHFRNIHVAYTCVYVYVQAAAPEIAMIKIAAPNMALAVIDRAIQVNS